MNLRPTHHQLRIFEAVARRSSFSRAAEELALTQPTISIQIRQLTETVGSPLFEQIGKKIYLTEAGRHLLATSRELLDVWSRFDSGLSDLQGVKAGTLRLAAVTTAKYFVPRLLGPFCDLYPGIDVSLEVGNRDAIIERLANNADDLTVMGVPPAHLEIHQQRFLANPLVMIAPANHPLARRRNLQLRDLSGERFIAREEGSGTRMAADRYLKAHGAKFAKTMQLGSNEAIKQAVAGGLGVAILSQHALQMDAMRHQFVVLRVEGFPIPRWWYVVYPQGKRLSVLATTFQAYLLKAAREGTFAAPAPP